MILSDTDIVSRMEAMMKSITLQQKKDKSYIKQLVKSPVIQDQILRFKQMLEDARSNFLVSLVLSVIGLHNVELSFFKVSTTVGTRADMKEGFSTVLSAISRSGSISHPQPCSSKEASSSFGGSLGLPELDHNACVPSFHRLSLSHLEFIV
jgi:hypothetical protein